MNITDCIQNAIVREFPDLVVSFSENDIEPFIIFVDNIPFVSDFLIVSAVEDLIGQCVGSKTLVSLDLHVDYATSAANAKYVIKLDDDFSADIAAEE